MTSRQLARAYAGNQVRGLRSRLGMDLMNAGKMVSYGQVKPVYMRKAEAERKLEEACQK